MCDTWINWRFGVVHFQLGKNFSFIRLSKNEYHAKENRPINWKWFERY